MPAFGKIRIISGQWRGRNLDIPNIPELKPTPNRIRETLFNWLQQSVVAARCLDLFAGSGALSFEALSRGATKVFMVESNPHLIRILERHAQMLGSNNHVIECADAFLWCHRQIKGFDIIFLDPPFGRGYIEKSCALIRQKSLLNDQGLVYVEAEKDITLPLGWSIKKEMRTHQVKSMLIKPNWG